MTDWVTDMGGLRNLLRDLDRSREEVARLHEKLDQQWTACLGMGGHGDSGGIGGGGTGGPRDSQLVSFSDTVELLIQARTRQMKAEKRLEGLLKTMSERPGNGRRDALLLRDRYLRRLTWRDILDDLKHEGFQVTTLRTVYLWHSDALRWGDAIWEELYHDERLHDHTGL